MATKEQIQNLMCDIQEHEAYDAISEALENTVCEELEVNGQKLICAIADDDVDAILQAITGWDTEALLARARIIQDRKGYFPSRQSDGADTLVYFPDF